MLLPLFHFSCLHFFLSLFFHSIIVKIDKDEIGVGRFEGFFDALQLKVEKRPINMHKMVVHFHNGETREIELRDNFTAGSEIRIIDLPRNRRIIDKVVFWYDTKDFANGKAIVELWGRH